MLSDNLIQLRRKSGLSQEQLADKIGVSRQAISKWECGQSTPELEKLMAMSELFNVSLDELTKGPSESPAKDTSAESSETKEFTSAKIVGIVLSILGAVLLIIAGILLISSPETATQINNSSMITINGTGIFLTLSVIPLVVGVILILKKK